MTRSTSPMQPRLILLVPLILIAGLLAIVGLRLGMMVISTSESEVIERYAAKYVAEVGEGAQITDCVARPATTTGVWLVVSCGRDRHFSYHVNRLGGLEFVERPGEGNGSTVLPLNGDEQI